MVSDVAHLVRAPDHALAVDEVRHPHRERRVLVVVCSRDLVGAAHRAVDVGEQAEAELLLEREPAVVLGRVERRAEDDAVRLPEVIGPVTQRPSLDRSAGGRGAWIPPHQHPLAAEGVEGHRLSVLIGQVERGGGRPGLQHGRTLPTGSAVVRIA